MSVRKFEEASQILQNVDVSEIVTSLALGIAEAQEKLDNNSVQQILRLSQQQVGGKSLIELGFVPAFYAFEYADVSASLNLKMALKTNINVGLKLELDNYRQKGYRKENIDIVEKERKESYRREFESSGEVIVRADSDKTIKVEEQYVSLDRREKCLTMIDSFKDRLRTARNVDRVMEQVITERRLTENNSSAGFRVVNFGGFILISMPEVSAQRWALLRITNYNGEEITLKSAVKFSIAGSFADTIDNVKNLTADFDFYGYEANKVGAAIYFAWDKHLKIDYGYSENGVGPYSGSVYENDGMDQKLRFLALVLKYNPSASIEIIGHADSSGPNSYNVKLSEKRVKTVSDVILGHMGVATSSQVTMKFPGSGEADANAAGEVNQKNPKYRRVDVILKGGADYIFFIGTDVSATPTSSGSDNTFVAKGGGSTSGGSGSNNPTNLLKFTYGGSEFTMNTSISTLDELENQTSISNHFNMEINGETAYLLHKESRIKFTALSESSRTINIEENIQSSESESDYRNEVEVYDTVDRNYFLQKDSEVLDNPGYIAFSGSLDARYQRQFDMSVEGSAAVSARMKAIPPPDKFIQHISRNEEEPDTEA